MSSGWVGCLLSTRTWLCAWKAAIKNVCLLPRASKGNAPILSALAWLALGWPWIYPHTHTHAQCVQLVLYADAPYAQVKVFNYAPACMTNLLVCCGCWWSAKLMNCADDNNKKTTLKMSRCIWKMRFNERERHIKASSCLGCQANKAGRQHTKMSRPERDRKTKFVYVAVQWKTYCKANRQS